MTEKGKKYLSDIILAIELIESFISDVKSFEQYQLDLKTQSAVERQLMIIGEAAIRFRQVCPEVSLENSLQIAGFRNRIVHAYDSIDNSIVWVIVNRHLESLKIHTYLLLYEGKTQSEEQKTVQALPPSQNIHQPRRIFFYLFAFVIDSFQE